MSRGHGPEAVVLLEVFVAMFVLARLFKCLAVLEVSWHHRSVRNTDGNQPATAMASAQAGQFLKEQGLRVIGKLSSPDQTVWDV